MRRLSLAALAPLAILTAAATASAAEDLPFLGTWDCGVGEFTFTADTYTPPGGEPLPILSIRREPDGVFVLAMPDGYEIGLSGIGETTMGWFSFASGDAFDCTRLR